MDEFTNVLRVHVVAVGGIRVIEGSVLILIRWRQVVALIQTDGFKGGFGWDLTGRTRLMPVVVFEPRYVTWRALLYQRMARLQLYMYNQETRGEYMYNNTQTCKSMTLLATSPGHSHFLYATLKYSGNGLGMRL